MVVDMKFIHGFLLAMLTRMTRQSGNVFQTECDQIMEGAEVELKCGAVEDARKKQPENAIVVMALEWRRNGAVVAHYIKESDGAEWYVSNPRFKLDRRSFSLNISNVTQVDNAQYTCIPKHNNNLRWSAESSHVACLKVLGPPTSPGRPSVTSFTARSVTLSWGPSATSSSIAPVLQYIILVNVGSKPNKSRQKKIYSLGNATTAHVSSLTPYTKYTFEIVAENFVGRSVPGPSSYPLRTLGEAPVAAPKIKSVYNATNTSLLITWEAPPSNTVHGLLAGYRFMAHQLKTGARKEYYLANPEKNSFELEKLLVYTKYMISLEADNNFGYSPADNAVVLTEEGVPTTAPVITSLHGLTSSSFAVVWAPPRKCNGIVRLYTIYYNSSDSPIPNLIKVRDVDRGHTVIRQHIENLEPFMKYSVWISASTQKGEGPPSEISPVFTDVDVPGRVKLSNLAVRPPSTVLLEWDPPAIFYRSVDLYMLRFYQSPTGSYLLRKLNTTAQSITLTIQPHELGKAQFLSIRATTRSIIKQAKLYLGLESQKEAFKLQGSAFNGMDSTQLLLKTTVCDADGLVTDRNVVVAGVTYNVKTICDHQLRSGDVELDRNQESRTTHSQTTIALFGSLGLMILLIGCIFFVFLWRRRLREKSFTSGVAGFIAIDQDNLDYDMHDDLDHPSIPVSDFVAHVLQQKADGNAGFAEEFQSLSAFDEGQSIGAYQSLLPGNRHKNRYVNILAYDHSRVVLRTIARGASKSSDYINANYVDGYNKRRAYIAAQGPLPNTFADFWRMIWEQRTLVIVMITNLVEKGRKKCDHYWPAEGSEIYGGQFQIRLLNEYTTAFYTVRMLTIRNLRIKAIKLGAERVVFHYHYTNWPDHGVPSSPLPVLTFVRKSTAANRDNAGPMVVHCSAGVGRSGTYIVIDSMLRQLSERPTINIFAFLKHIRQQRSFLVQTEEQYTFCHIALVEFLRSGNTEISTTDLATYFSSMESQKDGGTEKNLLQSQYELAMEVEDCSFKLACKPCNIDRNRSTEVIPVDAYRVPLSCSAGEDSDYINASFMPGFHKLNEYIITQCPLYNTVDDFWRLIWEHNCQTMVILCEIDQFVCKRFWPEPDEDCRQYRSFYVYATERTIDGCWECLDFILQSSEDDFQLPCRLLHYPAWSGRCTGQEVWDLVQTVQDWHLEYQNGPLVVVDKFGGTGAATFCALTSLLSQLEQESSVDVYQLVKLYNARRPAMFPTCETYRFLYECLISLLSGGCSDVHDSGYASKFKLSASVPNGLRHVTNGQLPMTQMVIENNNTLCKNHTETKLTRDLTL